jgi:hypothetical protein
MKPKHSPAPWDNLKGQGFIHCPATDQVVCQLWSKYEDDFHNHKANAELIALAPDLAWVLYQIIRDLPQKRDWLNPDLERIAKALLKKIHYLP